MKHLNIELKARCGSPDKIREILKSRAAVFKGSGRQIDTYFNAPSGRLKLREGGLEHCLVYYERENDAGPKRARVVLQRLEENSSALKEILSRLLGVSAVVRKVREIYFTPLEAESPPTYREGKPATKKADLRFAGRQAPALFGRNTKQGRNEHTEFDVPCKLLTGFIENVNSVRGFGVPHGSEVSKVQDEILPVARRQKNGKRHGFERTTSNGVKFHLDEVDGLGTFVEIEAMDGGGAHGEDALLEQCRFYKDLFGISEEDLVLGSYRELVLETQKGARECA